MFIFDKLIKTFINWFSKIIWLSWLIILIIVVSLIAYCSKVKADPLADLEKFTAKPKAEKIIKEKKIIPPKTEIPKEESSPAISTVVDKTEINKREDKEQSFKTSNLETQTTSLPPFIISHTLSKNHSFRVISNYKKTYLNINSQWTPLDFESISFIKEKIKSYLPFDPKFDFGVIGQVHPFNQEIYFTAGFSAIRKIKNHFAGIKVEAIGNQYKQILENSKGRVSFYYSYIKLSALRSGDITTFYAGWHSPVFNLKLSDNDSFLKELESLEKHSDNLTIGINYFINLYNRINYNFELGLKKIVFAVNLEV